MCAEACPASLLPQQLFWFAQGKELEKLESHNLFDCIECGACAWVCPSNIPLVQYYRASKAEIQQQRRDQAKSDHSRERFEARQARLDREEAEKAAKRAARKKAAEQRAAAAAADGGDEDPIQAAIERAKAKKAAQAASGASQSEQEKLEKAVDSTRKRLATAEGKLAEAEAAGADHVAALKTGVEKTRGKLAAAEKALADYMKSNSPDDAPAATADPAQAAIDRAMKARAAEADASPEDRARTQLEKLRQRLQKSEQRLAEGQAAGEDDKILEALAASVDRLKGKIAEAEAELTAAEDA